MGLCLAIPQVSRLPHSCPMALLSPLQATPTIWCLLSSGGALTCWPHTSPRSTAAITLWWMRSGYAALNLYILHPTPHVPHSDASPSPQAVEELLESLDLEKSSYHMGLSRVGALQGHPCSLWTGQGWAHGTRAALCTPPTAFLREQKPHTGPPTLG